MNKTKIATLGLAILFAVLTVSTASANVSLYFTDAIAEPDGTGHYSAEVEVWTSVEDGHTAKSGQFGIHYDPSCITITEHPIGTVPDGWGPMIDESMASWCAYPNCCCNGTQMLMYTFRFNVPTDPWCPSPQMIAKFTVQCKSSACLSTLRIACGGDDLDNGDGSEKPGEEDCFNCPVMLLDKDDIELYPDCTDPFVDGIFDCGISSDFEKELVPGWNLISLPLTNATDMTVANIMDTSLSGSYDGLFRYDASTDNFVVLDSTDMMENGVGYFIHMTATGVWTYDGKHWPYESIEISLSEGLNCIGWTNTNASLPDALSSMQYNYVARWNATSQNSYEVYDVNAPTGVPGFIDFTTMERGNGYWIAAKEDCTLTVS